MVMKMLFGILNTVDSNKVEFIENSLHTLGNSHLNASFCAQKESSMDNKYFSTTWS